MAATLCRRRNGVVGNHPNHRQRDRTGTGIEHHPLMQSPRVMEKLLELGVGADREAALPQFEQRTLFRLRHGAAVGHSANRFVVAFFPVGPKLIAQSIRFDLKVFKLNAG